MSVVGCKIDVSRKEKLMYFCDIDDTYQEHSYCVECGELVCIACHTAYGCPEDH